MAASTWSTTDKSASLTLTGSNLIATAAAGNQGVRGKDPKRTGKYYVEYTPTTGQGATSAFGFATAKAVLGTAGPASSAAPQAAAGTIVIMDWFGTQIAGTGGMGAMVVGTPVCVAIDLDNQLIWFRNGAAGNWNNNATHNPATGVGGNSIASAGFGQGIDVYPFAFLLSSANSVTANFGGSAFTGAVPAGFTSGWDDSVTVETSMVATQAVIEEWASGAPAMQLTQAVIEEWGSVATWSPFTTWSQTDKTTDIAISNSDLTATAVQNGNQAIRTVDRQITGKFYFEYTHVNNVNNCCGIANQSVAIGGIAGNNGTTPNTVVITAAGAQLFVNGVSASVSLGAISNGGFSCWALDLTNKLVWVRNGAAGQWNGSGTANPATGAGGVSIASVVSEGIPAYGLMAATNGTAASITANFGAAAFSGTVPSGFTSGFPSGAVVPNNAIATQFALEEWGSAVAPAQLTQILVEEWASVLATYPTPLTATLLLSASRAGVGSVVLGQDNASRTVMIADVGVLSQAAQVVPSTGTTVRAMILA